MKFSEHLRETSIPEWEDKYLNYKAGKKLIKKYVDLQQNNEESIDTKKLFIDDWVIKGEYKKCESFYLEEVKTLLGCQDLVAEVLLENNCDDHDKNQLVENFFIKEHHCSVGSILLQIRIYTLMMKEREEIITSHKMRRASSYGTIYKPDDNVIFADNTSNISQTEHSLKNNFLLWLDEYDILPSLPSLDNFAFFKNRKKNKNKIENENEPLLSNQNFRGISNIQLLDDENLDNDDSTNIMSIKTEWIWNWHKINKLLSDSTYELIALLQKLEMYRNSNIQAIIKIVKKYDKRTGNNESSNIKKFLIDNSIMCRDLLMEKFDDGHSSLLEEDKPTDKPEFTSKLHEAIKILSHHYTTTLAIDKKDSKKRKIFLKQSNNIMNNQFSEFLVHKFNLTFKELFISGIQIGLSLAIIIKTLHYGRTIEAVNSVQHKILLPIWGGFYLIALMALLYQLNCYIWFHFKINYKFIMFGEIKPLKLNQFGVLTNFYNDFSNTEISRNLLLISLILLSCCLLSMGSLSQNGMLEPYCTIFIFGVLPLVFSKPEWIYPFLEKKKDDDDLESTNRHSTMWLLTPFIRLFGAFWYPVEFSDLGDILCSLGYSFTNLFLIYCYDYCATKDDYSQCSSSNSYTMGILSAIPNWLRALQCARRFLDSGDWFPHVPNGFKYFLGAVFNLALMFYRLNPLSQDIKYGFIVIAILNSLITAIWDILLDFSLLQSWDKNTFGLRKTLLLCKSRNWETNKYDSWKEKSFYYFAIVEDFILRFNWVVYFIFPKNIQQNAMTSIFMAFMEMFRRFIWIILRIENLQVVNVTLYNISIDHMKLPYQIGFQRNENIPSGEDTYAHRASVSNLVPDYESVNDLQEQISLMEEVTRYYSNNPSVLKNNDSLMAETNSIRSSVMIPKRFRRASSALNMIHNSIPFANSQDFQRPKSKNSVIEEDLYEDIFEVNDESDRRTIHNGILLKKSDSSYMVLPSAYKNNSSSKSDSE
ncbi:hypothetical protein ACO0SA_004426 [Hanseniaspora valbyensis]